MVECKPEPEVWVPIPGYEGSYEVSDLGRVRSLDRLVPAGPRVGQRISRGRVLKPCYNSRLGRYAVDLHLKGDRKVRLVATLVAEAFLGPRPPGYQACHNDGDATNDHLSNIRWDTPSENMYDKTRHGTHHLGKKTHCIRGHLLVEPNLVRGHKLSGGRTCRACNRACSSQRYARKQGFGFDLQAEADVQYRKIMPSA